MEPQWIWAVVGGIIVGFGGCVFLLANGRVLGSSGVLGGLVDGSGRNNRMEGIAFIAGLVGFPALMSIFSAAPDTTHATGNMLLLVSGGILTGIGTRIANGCTSGHAISGMSRFSLRSFIATFSYLSAAVVTVTLFRHIWSIV